MNEDPSSESNNKIFDRIFKENAYDIFMPLIQRELGIKIKSYEPLPAELPRTIGRRVDFFCRITTTDNKEVLLHVEFQTKDDYEMLERVGEYHGIMFRKYRLPIRHVVVFLDAGKSKMRTQLLEEEIYQGFDLINISQLNTEELLSSQVPEVVLLALLSNYEKDRTETVLRLIVRKLKSVAYSEAQLKKYVEQLILLSKLRKLSEITDQIVHDMPVTYDYTEDFYYLKGRATEREIAIQEIEEEREKAKQEREKTKQEKIAAIQSLLSIKKLSIKQIADTMSVTEDFVKHISEREIE